MIISGSQGASLERCRELGLAAYLWKPVGESQLQDALARALGGHEQAARIAPSTGPDENAPAAQLRILVAEDNPVNQNVAERLLQKRGHHVVVANNGLEALAALKMEEFDLLFMDIQMSQMGGVEATVAIREPADRRLDCKRHAR